MAAQPLPPTGPKLTGGRLSPFRSISLIACLAAALSCHAQFDEVQRHVTEFTLKNGMKFIVLERHEAPVVSFHTYADVGSAQETKGITGLAHLFEHMAFKGSRNIGTRNISKEIPALDKVDRAFDALNSERRRLGKPDPEKLKLLEEAFATAQKEAAKFVVRNEFGEAIERAGGQNLNATTASDRTTYYFSLPSNSTELWFFLESERFLRPVFREFYKEVDVVKEERRMSTDSQPVGRLLEEFLSVAYKAHPYGEPTIGHMSDLDQLTRPDAAAFFTKHYAPSNLTAAIVGDVSPARIRELAEAYFGRIPARAKPDPLRTIEPPQNGERRVQLQLEAQPLTLIGFHKPDINHPDNAVYEAISSLLSGGRSSRLNRGLVRDKKVAVESGGFGGLPGVKYPGLFLFYAFVAPGHSNEEVERAIAEEIQKLIREPVSAAELDGVKRRARANLIRSLEDDSGMAAALASYQALTGDWKNLFLQLDKINAVTPADIQRVSAATFVVANRTVGTIETAPSTVPPNQP